MKTKFKKTALTVYQANHNSDKRRASVKLHQTTLQTLLWEHIREIRTWTRMTELYIHGDATTSEARQMRRLMHRWWKADFLEIAYRQDRWKPGPRYAVFRVRAVVEPEDDADD